MTEKTDRLSNWTYPDFPKPDNEAERIDRIAELSLEQFLSLKYFKMCARLPALSRSVIW